MITTNELKYGEIIKVNGLVGMVVTDKNKKYFWDKSTTMYYTPMLNEITEFEKASHDEKVKFLIHKDFTWGEVVNTHMFGEFLIFEYIDKQGEKKYHSYQNYRDMSRGFPNLYWAAVGCIAEKFDGINTRADLYFVKSIGLAKVEEEIVQKVNASNEPAYGEIIKVDGLIGVVVSDMENRKRFWDKSTRTYSSSQLPFLGDYEKTTHEEKVEFLIKHFTWGTVVDSHVFAEYLIFEYIDKEGKTYFHPYDNYHNMNRSYETIYSTISGVIAIKFDGVNTRADEYFAKAIGME